jgi:hypothetical protein
MLASEQALHGRETLIPIPSLRDRLVSTRVIDNQIYCRGAFPSSPGSSRDVGSSPIERHSGGWSMKVFASHPRPVPELPEDEKAHPRRERTLYSRIDDAGEPHIPFLPSALIAP